MIHHVAYHTGFIPPNDLRRMDIAKMSWLREYVTSGHAMRALPIEVSMSKRRDSRILGELEPVPFLRDMIESAISANGVYDDDIVFLTNADVGFTQGITQRIKEGVKKADCCHLKRHEHQKIEHPISTEEENRKGVEYMGMDGFAFTVEWWRDVENMIPDLLIGRYGWDCVMRNLIRRSGGSEIKDCLWHERHDSRWLNAGMWELLLGNQHNLKLVDAWIAQYGGSKQDHLLTDDQLIYK